jgi:hypothetical protein
MNVPTVTINRIFKTYQGQSRIAELNDKNPVKRTQGQRDQVSISKEARTSLALHWAKRLKTFYVQAEKMEEVEAEGNAENEENITQESVT